MDNKASKDSLLMVSDYEPSMLSCPFVTINDQVYACCFEASFDEIGIHFLVMTGGDWKMTEVSLPVTSFDKSRLEFTFKSRDIVQIPEKIFYSYYVAFYKKLILEMYTLSEEKCKETVLDPQVIGIGDDLKEAFNSNLKNYMFFPAKLIKQSGKLDFDHGLMREALDHWNDYDLGQLREPVDIEDDIVQARYGKHARYTVVKEFDSVRNMKAAEVYEYLMQQHMDNEEMRKQAETVYAAKFHFSLKELKKMSIDDLLTRLPEMPPSVNDLYSVKQIEKYHSLYSDEDDRLLLVMPICNARSILCSNPKENVKPAAMNQSLRNEFLYKKPSTRHIFLLGRYLRKAVLSLRFWERLMILPLGLFEIEKRLINLEMERRFRLEFKNTGTTVFWKALQTQMVDSSDNFETLETLGDSVLKIVITLLLYSKYDFKESSITYLRMKIINNMNLQTKGLNQKIFKFVYHNHRKLKEWTPGLMKSDSHKLAKSNQISSSMLADIVEALIGAIFLAANRSLNEILMFIIEIGIWPQKETGVIFQDIEDSLPNMPELFRGEPLKSFDKLTTIDPHILDLEITYSQLFKMTAFEYPRRKLTREFVGNNVDRRIEMLEKVLGYCFKNKRNIEIVIERGRFSREFERFELLGDAAIEFRAVDLAYNLMPQFYKYFEPHDLHKAKIYLLSNHNLSFFTSFFYLDCFVDEDISQACTEIREYAEKSKFGQFLRHEMVTIKLLGDIWESLMAALIIDGGWPAFDNLYTRAIEPFIIYICKFNKYLEGSAKSAAFEIIEKSKIVLETKQIAENQWMVKLYNSRQEPVEEFIGDTQAVAEELCYFYITYKYDYYKKH